MVNHRILVDPNTDIRESLTVMTNLQGSTRILRDLHDFLPRSSRLKDL